MSWKCTCCGDIYRDDEVCPSAEYEKSEYNENRLKTIEDEIQCLKTELQRVREENKAIDEKVKTVPKCNFCYKGKDDVEKLIYAPGVYICNECVDLCNVILQEELPKWPWSKQNIKE